MTFKELCDEVIRRLEETGTPSHWALQEIKDSINDGYTDLCDTAEPYERKDLLPYDTNIVDAVTNIYLNLSEEYKYQEPYLGLTRVYNLANDRWLEPTTAMELDASCYRQWQKMVTGEPRWFLLRGFNQFATIPIKDGTVRTNGELEVYRKALPMALVMDDDEPVFNREYHSALADYACFDLLADDLQVDTAKNYQVAYLAAREVLRSDKSAGTGVEGASRVRVMGGVYE